MFAASSLTDAFTEIAQDFEARHSGFQVVFNFSGSSQLVAQILEGAQADVFASANELQLLALHEAGRTEPASTFLFATNRLTIIVPAGNPAGIASLEDLAEPGIALLLAGPGVPVRTYTDEVVARMPEPFRGAFYRNLVSEEDNVRQVVAKIALGEADAGIVYSSDVTPDVAGKLQRIELPPELQVTAVYPIAALNDAPHPDPARMFIDFVLGPEGQAILESWGFGPPPQ